MARRKRCGFLGIGFLALTRGFRVGGKLSPHSDKRRALKPNGFRAFCVCGAGDVRGAGILPALTARQAECLPHVKTGRGAAVPMVWGGARVESLFPRGCR